MLVLGTDHDTHDGTCVRDYIHVSDLVGAHVKGSHTNYVIMIILNYVHNSN